MKTEKAEPEVESDESETVVIHHPGSFHDLREVFCPKGLESFELDGCTYARKDGDRDIFIPRPKGTDH